MAESTAQINARAKAAGGFKVMQPIISNKSADVFYRNAIDAECDKMITAIIYGLEKVYTTIRENNAVKSQNAEPKLSGRSIKNIEKLLDYYKLEYTPIFVRNSERIIRKWLNRASRNARTSIKRNLEALVGETGDYSIQMARGDYDEILRLIVQRNVGLIQNTTSQTLSNIENIVYDGITTGQNWQAVSKDLNKQKHIAQDRIKRIARDQTGKANEALNELIQRDSGVQFFQWRTVGDERVSTGYGGHKQLDGKIYKWGDTAHYPVVDSYGHRGIPHQRPQCRCSALAVLLRKDYIARQTPEGDWRIIKGRL